jgi:hypothetical protein
MESSLYSRELPFPVAWKVGNAYGGYPHADMQRLGRLMAIAVAIAVLEIAAYVLGTDAGTLLAAGAIIVAWLTYRAQQDTARRGVLDALDVETRMFLAWLGAQYDVGAERRDAWWSSRNLRQALESGEQPVLTVNRLSTVAIDNAITQGPALFINLDLVFALVQYRQRVEQLNQLIDNATVLQQGPDLWKRPLDADVFRHFALSTAWIHWVGIGTGDPKRGNADGAHVHFLKARFELEREIAIAGLDWWSWFIFGRTWPRQKRSPIVEVVKPS